MNIGPSALLTLFDKIHLYPDFPKEGILFRDISPLLADKAAFQIASHGLDIMADEFEKFDTVACVESRGFLFGPIIALNKVSGVVMIRKKNKLPGKKFSKLSKLEYGEELLEVAQGMVGKTVLIVDDVLATGGTSKTVAEMMTACGAKVVGFLFLLEIPGLGGRGELEKTAPVWSLITK